MRAKTEQPHLSGDSYKLCSRQMPRPSASRKPAFLAASCMRICGIFPPLAYEKGPRKRWHKAKGTIKFPWQNSKNEEDSSLICKTLTVKVIGINKSGNILAHHFWKLQMHDQGQGNYNAVRATWHSGLHVFLPGSATRWPPALPSCSLWLESCCCTLRLTLEERKFGKSRCSSLFSHCCLFPSSVCSHARFSLGVSV